jgi:hypothetical protein
MMKALKNIFLFFCLTVNTTVVLSNTESEFLKAREYLEKKGEVYYSFSVNSISEIEKLSDIVSIDNVQGTRVHAYANKKEWQTFLESGLDYDVLTHPGDLLRNPAMYYGKPGESFDWDKYPTYDEYIAMMNQYEVDYPDLCRIYEIGESHNGRKILVAKVSDNVSADESEPGFLSASTMHGDETCGFLLMLRMIDYLLFNYDSDPRVRRIVDSIEMWINPNLNPDGTYNGGNNTVSGARRYNANNVDINRNFPNHIGGAHPDGNAYQKETEACLEFESQHHLVMGADLHGGIECALTPWACQFEKPLDNDWFLLIAHQYAMSAQSNSSTNYFVYNNDGVGNGASDLYIAEGIRLDWQFYYNHCRGLTIELSYAKTLPENKLDDHWNYNKDALLSFYEQVLNGIRGIVTDTFTNEPLAAKVFVENLDKDSNHVYSWLPHGNYYRPVYQGEYDLTFSADGYYPKTISGVAAENNEATILDVQLTSETGILAVHENRKNIISIKKCKNTFTITFDIPVNNKIAIALFDISGKLVRTLPLSTSSGKNCVTWNGFNNNGNSISAGCYIVRVENNGNVITERFIFSN